LMQIGIRLQRQERQLRRKSEMDWPICEQQVSPDMSVILVMPVPPGQLGCGLTLDGASGRGRGRMAAGYASEAPDDDGWREHAVKGGLLYMYDVPGAGRKEKGYSASRLYEDQV